MSADQDVIFFMHEVCRGPVVHVDMKLSKVRHSYAGKEIAGSRPAITTTLKHASGDVCRFDTTQYMFLLKLEKINEAICFYKSTGAGFNCDPKIIDECQLVLRTRYRNFTCLNKLEEPLLCLKNSKNTPMSLSMHSRLVSTSNPTLWAQLENKPKSLKDNLLPDIPTHEFGIKCMRDRYMFMGQSLIPGYPDANGLYHMTPVIQKSHVSYSIVRNEAATICNDIDPEVEYAVCFGYCKGNRGDMPIFCGK